jgi:hypothetical protein
VNPAAIVGHGGSLLDYLKAYFDIFARFRTLVAPKIDFMFLKKCGAFTLLLALASCKPSSFMVITSPAQIDQRSKKVIYLSSDWVEEADHFAVMINLKRHGEFNRAIQKLDDVKKRKFLQGIHSLVSDNYEQAYTHLVTLPPSEFDFEVQLLLADAIRARKLSDRNYFPIYQSIVDSTKNTTIKLIANDRWRFIKYESTLQ